MIQCKNCPHLYMDFVSNERVIIFNSECTKYGVIAGYPAELKEAVIQEHGKPCEFSKQEGSAKNEKSL